MRRPGCNGGVCYCNKDDYCNDKKSVWWGDNNAIMWGILRKYDILYFRDTRRQTRVPVSCLTANGTSDAKRR